MIDDMIWTEKYRPTKLDEIVGQDAIINRLKAYVNRGNIQHLIFSGPPGIGKSTAAIVLTKEIYGNDWKSNFKELNASVSKNTPILLKTNEKRIDRVDFQYLDKYYGEDANIDNLEVLSVDKDLKVKWSKITKLIKHKVNKILKISYEGGTLELTGNHSVIVFDNAGILISKAAGDLKEGDFLISFCTNLEDTKVIEEIDTTLVKLDENNSWLYGIYRSEGCLAINHIVLTLGSHEHEYIDRIRNISENKLHINTSETLCGSGFKKENKVSSNQVKLFDTNIVPFFRNMFYDKHSIEHTAHTKRVPFFIYGHKLENRLSYLKGEYEGDGSDLYNNNFRVSSVSKNSLIDIAWLGRTSGFHTSIFPEDNVVNLFPKSFKSELIPAELVINLLTKISNSNKVNYNWRYDLRHILYKRKDTEKGINNRITKESLLNIMNKIKPKNQGTLSDFFGIISKEDESITKFGTILKSDLHSVEIKKVEVIEYNDYVYDVVIPENQMFFAGDMPILLHNSDARGIEVVRHEIKEYASTQSLGTIPYKTLFLDEADALCLDENTEIVIGKKSHKKISKVKDIPQDGYIDIPSLDIYSRQIVNDMGRCIVSDDIEMFKITLENGKEVIASGEHPFFKLNENGEINEIKVKELDEESKILDFQDDLNIVQCEICKKVIFKKASTVNTRFCSMECKNKGHSVAMTGKGNSNYGNEAWNKGKTIVDDERIAKQGHPGDTNCSKRSEVNTKKSELLKRFYQTEEGKQLSLDLAKHLSEMKKGKSFKELFPNLTEEELEERRKQSSSTYREEGNFKDSSYRRHLKGLKEVECCVCHEIIKVGGRDGIYVHHKDGNHENNAPENLEWACPKCHNLDKHDTMERFLKKGWEILRGADVMEIEQKSLMDY